jgi:hypothetical protein
LKINSGKLVILLILGAALAAAGFAWWRQYEQGRRALAYWGAEGARLIRTAPEVELRRLREAADEEVSPIQPRSRDVSHARGLVHARQALISDASYLWNEQSAAAPEWEYDLVFRDGSDEIGVHLDVTGAWAAPRRGRPPVRMSPRLAAGLDRFLKEQLTQAPP